MAKRIKKVPKKQIISIETFLNLYLKAPAYKKREKLTHNKLREHLKENGMPIPKRLRFEEITEEDIRKGSVLYVKDEKSHKIPYRNPHYISEDMLFRRLERKSKEELESIRNKILKLELKKRAIELSKEGFIEDEEGNLISFDELYYEKLEESYQKKKIKKTKKVVYIRKSIK